jgi:hypothetical protein
MLLQSLTESVSFTEPRGFSKRSTRATLPEISPKVLSAKSVSFVSHGGLSLSFLPEAIGQR